ncbi:helix-turn-helix domain-containing protein [Streptacidiphilus sp. EB129]|uniref:helix-turn-helix domain-containing protein n=1 Tax=Streptacidiphilus sp. EB129 TaxID=3156262 RepID=UPI003515CFBD
MKKTTLFCSFCGRQFSHQKRGRKPDYCAKRCQYRAASIRRARRKSEARPDLYDEEAKAIVQQHLDLSRQVQSFIDHPRPVDGAKTLLRKIAALHQNLDDLDTVLVQQLRDRGTSWATIGQGYGISAAKAQRRWGTDTHETASAPDNPTTALPGGAWGRLVEKLDRQRQVAGKTVAELDGDTRIDPAHIEAVLAGRSIPSWPVAEKIYEACGGNIRRLEPFWQAVKREAAQPQQQLFPSQTLQADVVPTPHEPPSAHDPASPGDRPLPPHT